MQSTNTRIAFFGLCGLDPFHGDGRRSPAGTRGERTSGFVGAHLYPHWFNLEPNAAKYYPFYAKCIELDVPVQMQVGPEPDLFERIPLQVRRSPDLSGRNRL